MDFKSPLFVCILMFVAMLAIGVFTVVIQLQLMNTSKMLLELTKNVSQLCTSRNVSNSSDNLHDPSGLYSFGGMSGYSTNRLLSFASRLNPASGKWEQIKSMSTKKMNFCGAAIGNKLYFFGGETQPRPAPSPSNKLNQVEVYDSLTNNYEQLESMPKSRTNCGAAALNGFIYVTGGYYSSQSVIRYDVQTDQWTTVSSMNVDRADHQLVALNDNLYAIAGFSNTMEVYNATSDQWTMGTSTKYKHKYFGAAVHEGKIYVCSHLGFEVYSPDTEKWSVLTPLNNYKSRTLVSMNGKLWALGGELPGLVKDSSKSVFTYDTLTGNWTQQAEMLVPQKYHFSLVVNP